MKKLILCCHIWLSVKAGMRYVNVNNNVGIMVVGKYIMSRNGTESDDQFRLDNLIRTLYSETDYLKPLAIQTR